jgi:Zn-dependent protease with chaperone function
MRALMTAQEYLEELQSVYRHYHYLLELVQDRRDLFARNKVRPPTADKDIPRYARELAAATLMDVLPNATAKELRDKLEYDVASHIARTRPELGWAQRAHSQFLSHASDMAKDLFTQNLDIAVGVLETASFNASAIPVPERERSWVIALNQEVSTVVYEVARTIAGTFNVRIGKAVGNEALSPKRAGRILHERLNHYMHMGIPYGNEYKVSREQIVLASNVTTMAERFVYAHELSHIILGHHVGAPLRALPDDWSEAVETVHEMDQEQEADLLAWELLTRVFVGSMGEFQMAYAGSFMFLRVADLLERAAEVVAVSTHPPASQRLVYLTEGAQRTAARHCPFLLLSRPDEQS